MAFRYFPDPEKLPFLALGFLAAMLVVLAYWARPGFMVSMDLKAFDAMTAARGVVQPPPEIVIVAVDEKSVNELGRWPWSRQRTAELIRMLAPAKVTAVDMVFSEPEDARSDAALASAVREAGNVVLGYFFRDDSTETPLKSSLAQLRRSKIRLVRFSGSAGAAREGASAPRIVPVYFFSGVDPNIPAIGERAAGFGSFNVFPHEDGLYRAAYLLYGYEGELYPVLALEAVREYYSDTLLVGVDVYGIDGINIDERRVPVNEEGRLLLDFYGPAGTFKTYSASDVLSGKVPAEALKDRLVFLGVTEMAISDIRPTPADPVFPGVELQATIAGNVLEGRYIVHDTRVVLFDLFLLILLPLVMSSSLARLRNTFVGLFLFIGLSALSVAGGYALYAFYGLRPGVVYPVLALLVSYISSEAYRNIVVEKKSRYLRKAFSTYVSNELVSEILKDPASLKLGGEKREVTVLFADIRGFTAISEGLEPEGLVRLLNEYLNPMTRIILDEKGTLDKYIGDAMMAVFNAPVAVEDHPERACRAALNMIGRLSELNAQWKAAGYPAVEAGVGINTGEAVVGNMGAELRFDYTAIGDTVNLSSRLEGLTKVYSAKVIVSEETKLAAGDGFLFRELDMVRVKGKKGVTAIHELMGEAPASASLVELSMMFSKAMELYRAGSFREAMDGFKDILKDYPGDGPSTVYLERCGKYLEDPPPPDWDGVYVAEFK